MKEKTEIRNIFSLWDFQAQLQEMDVKFIKAFFEKYPSKEPTDRLVSDLEIMAKQGVKHQLAILRSMRVEEIDQPNMLLNKSRLQRIADGSGTTIKEVKLLFKQYNLMRKLMIKLKRKLPDNDPPPAMAARMPLPQPPVITKAVGRKYR